MIETYFLLFARNKASNINPNAIIILKRNRAFSVQNRSCDHADFHLEEELINRNPQRNSFKRVPNATTNPEAKGINEKYNKKGIS